MCDNAILSDEVLKYNSEPTVSSYINKILCCNNKTADKHDYRLLLSALQVKLHPDTEQLIVQNDWKRYHYLLLN